MKWALLLGALWATVVCGGHASASEPSVAGLWEQVGDDGRVGGWFLFSEHDGLYDGRLVKVFKKQGEPTFERCVRCTGLQKNAPMLGLTIVKGMKRYGRRYEGGTILDPRDGAVYDAEMELSADGQRLSVRGYLGIPLFGQTQVWRRLPDNAMAPSEIPEGPTQPHSSHL